MVGGLVEQQTSRIDEQSPRERDTHAPPSGELLGPFLLHISGETQAMEDGGGTGFRGV